MDTAKPGKWLSCQKGSVSRSTNLKGKKDKKRTTKLLPWESRYQHTLYDYLKATNPNDNKVGKTCYWKKDILMHENQDKNKLSIPMESSLVDGTPILNAKSFSQEIKSKVSVEKEIFKLKSTFCDNTSSVETPIVEFTSLMNPFRFHYKNLKQADDISLAYLAQEIVLYLENEHKSSNLVSALEKACLNYEISQLDNVFSCSLYDGIPSIQTIINV